MRSAVRRLVTVLLWVLLLSSCTAMTGKTAGQNVDDATITASVKAKLATQEAASTLTRVGVNTDRGIVHLDGIVLSEEMRQKAIDVAKQVAGVRGVVNNLQIQ
jgi:hyperosmotically inducible periplasmic protein